MIQDRQKEVSLLEKVVEVLVPSTKLHYIGEEQTDDNLNKLSEKSREKFGTKSPLHS